MPRNRDQDLLFEVGRRVAKARRDRGFTQEDLSESIGIEPVTLSRLEGGHRALSLSTLSKISVVLGVGLGDLIDNSRPLTSPDLAPQEAELLRLYQAIPKKKRGLLIRLAKELGEK